MRYYFYIVCFSPGKTFVFLDDREPNKNGLLAAVLRLLIQYGQMCDSASVKCYVTKASICALSHPYSH